MSKSKLNVVKELINDKQYAEARMLLNTMPNNPTARKLLTQLDKAEQNPQSTKRSTHRLRNISVAFLIVIVIAAIMPNNNKSRSSPNSTATQASTMSQRQLERTPTQPTLRETSRANPAATSIPLASTFASSTPTSAPVPHPSAIGSPNGLYIQVDDFELRTNVGRRQTEKGAFLILYATLQNTSESRQCVSMRNISLVFDDEIYRPESSAMDALQDELAVYRDYLGSGSQCVQAGDTALTFAIFDVPLQVSSAEVLFFDNQRDLPISWESQAVALLATQEHYQTATQSEYATYQVEQATQAARFELTIEAERHRIATEIALTPTLPPEIARARQIILNTPTNIDEEDIRTLVVNELTVTLRYYLQGAAISGEWARNQAEREFPTLVCELLAAGYTVQDFAFSGLVTFVDAYGNTSEGEGVEMILPQEDAARINCDSPFQVNLPAIAERYYVHSALNR